MDDDLAWLLRNERRHLKELRDIQNRKLRCLVKNAYENVPFYRNLFDSVDLRPEAVLSVSDLAKIPMVDKHDFHKREKEGLLDRRIKNTETLRELNTSGSSGCVLKLYVDQKYNQLRKAQFLRPYFTNGNGLFGETVWLRARPTLEGKFHQRLGLMKEHQLYSGTIPDILIQMIQKIKPKFMRGYGSTFQLMATRVLEENLSVPSAKCIFTDSELLSEVNRQRIQEAFKTEVIDVYGTFESENIAYECNHHKGYHMAIDCSVIEFVKDGVPVNAGETGEVVFTVLDNYTFPFIRYNIGDLASYTDQPCTCGRTFPLMEISAGRVFDFAVLRSGDKISASILIDQLLHFEKFIQEFQIIQESLNLFTVLVIPSKHYHDEMSRELIEVLQAELQNATVNIQLTDNIDREKSGQWKAFKALIQT